MDFLEPTRRIMGMRPAVWERHANPWSVYTRIPILPLLTLAVWSRVWIGWWALAPVLLLAFWSWLNPRAFPPPASTEGWASKAVLGERLWMRRRELLVPRHHVRAAALLSGLALLGAGLLCWGLAILHPWLTLLGLTLAVLGKLWFVDRMAWFYEEQSRQPERTDRAEK
ncbi:DUF6653 family protein [Paucidesulfovibrio longus]|uniref:DUF6653 family protein n=1 Tax=Paucidesulfovibrio longus TaxID=889 RepID=UPI0003B55B47|nr:DUF6653 family protein [Paucidesulfovibrio longus]